MEIATSTEHQIERGAGGEARRVATPPVPLQLEYQPQFDMDLVQRLLGGARRRNTLTRTTEERLQRHYRPVLENLDPKVTWWKYSLDTVGDKTVCLENGVSFTSRKMASTLEDARQLVCFVATVGDKIDQMIENCMEEGRIADAYVIDAMGSGAIEHTAAQFQNDFVDHINDGDYVCGLRFSPGYCDWSISEQHKLFSLLDCDSIGVELSDTSLMSPRKSVSAVFGLYDRQGAPQIHQHNPCNRCAKVDCIARRTDEQQDSPH